MLNENKKRALDEAINKIEKDFGKGSVMRLGDGNACISVETVPTGALSLDIALELGGIAAFVDAEHALDHVYEKNIGVDINELYISQPDSGD